MQFETHPAIRKEFRRTFEKQKNASAEDTLLFKESIVRLLSNFTIHEIKK